MSKTGPGVGPVARVHLRAAARLRSTGSTGQVPSGAIRFSVEWVVVCSQLKLQCVCVYLRTCTFLCTLVGRVGGNTATPTLLG